MWTIRAEATQFMKLMVSLLLFIDHELKVLCSWVSGTLLLLRTSDTR